MVKILLASGLLLLAGCGYTFQGSGTVLPPDIKRIQIPIVENESTESGLSRVVTEALRDRFERYGVVTIVDNISEADAILNAKILNVRRETETVTSDTDTTLQSNTTLTVAAELKRVTGPILWRDANMSVSRTTGATSSVVVTSSPEFAQGTLGSQQLSALGSREVERGQESQSLDILADEVARRIYDAAVAPDF